MSFTASVSAFHSLLELCKGQEQTLEVLERAGICSLEDVEVVKEPEIRSLELKDLVVQRRLIEYAKTGSRDYITEEDLQSLGHLCRHHKPSLITLHRHGIFHLTDILELQEDDITLLPLFNLVVVRRLREFCSNGFMAIAASHRRRHRYNNYPGFDASSRDSAYSYDPAQYQSTTDGYWSDEDQIEGEGEGSPLSDLLKKQAKIALMNNNRSTTALPPTVALMDDRPKRSSSAPPASVKGVKKQRKKRVARVIRKPRTRSADAPANKARRSRRALAMVRAKRRMRPAARPTQTPPIQNRSLKMSSGRRGRSPGNGISRKSPGVRSPGLRTSSPGLRTSSPGQSRARKSRSRKSGSRSRSPQNKQKSRLQIIRQRRFQNRNSLPIMRTGNALSRASSAGALRRSRRNLFSRMKNNTADLSNRSNDSNKSASSEKRVSPSLNAKLRMSKSRSPPGRSRSGRRSRPRKPIPGTLGLSPSLEKMVARRSRRVDQMAAQVSLPLKL